MPIYAEPSPARSGSSSEDASMPKLLVVDDSEFERNFIARLLGDFPGIRLQFAADGAAALQLIQEDPPALVLTDLVMPGVDGLELVRRVKENQPGLPIILMTAYGGEEEAVAALRAGAVDYIPKTRLDRDLAPTLRRAMDVFRVERRRRTLERRLRGRTSDYELGCEAELLWMLAQVMAEEVADHGLLERPGQMRLHVALQEALANALYHGNLELDSALRQDDESVFYGLAEERRHQTPYSSRRIRVRSAFDRHAAIFVITDDGPGFDVSILDRQIAEDDLSRIGGRGLLLMRTFMDEVVYNARGNSVTMTKRFTPLPSPPPPH